MRLYAQLDRGIWYWDWCWEKKKNFSVCLSSFCFEEKGCGMPLSFFWKIEVGMFWNRVHA